MVEQEASTPRVPWEKQPAFGSEYLFQELFNAWGQKALSSAAICAMPHSFAPIREGTRSNVKMTPKVNSVCATSSH
jgi:hypothetical protein